MELKQANLELTISILRDCKEVGYKMLTIGPPDPKNPACTGWSTGPDSLWASGSLNSSKRGSNNESWPRVCGWPAIWRIADKHGINSCGNGHQHQIYKSHHLAYGTFMLDDLDAEIERLKHLWFEVNMEST